LASGLKGGSFSAFGLARREREPSPHDTDYVERNGKRGIILVGKLLSEAGNGSRRKGVHRRRENSGKSGEVTARFGGMKGEKKSRVEYGGKGGNRGPVGWARGSRKTLKTK